MCPSPYAFVLYIVHILLCYFGIIIFLEYDLDLWSIEHCHIWGSVTVAGLFQDYKNRSGPCFGASAVKLLMCSHVGFSLAFGT